MLHNDRIVCAEVLYFDSKKEKIFNSFFNDKNVNDKYTFKAHLCLVQEPGSNYLSYLCPRSGKANDMAESIMEYIEGYRPG